MFGARSRHSGGVDTLFGDGSVKFIKNSINLTIWRGISTTSRGRGHLRRRLLKVERQVANRSPKTIKLAPPEEENKGSN